MAIPFSPQAHDMPRIAHPHGLDHPPLAPHACPISCQVANVPIPPCFCFCFSLPCRAHVIGIGPRHWAEPSVLAHNLRRVYRPWQGLCRRASLPFPPFPLPGTPTQSSFSSASLPQASRPPCPGQWSRAAGRVAYARSFDGQALRNPMVTLVRTTRTRARAPSSYAIARLGGGRMATLGLRARAREPEHGGVRGRRWEKHRAATRSYLARQGAAALAAGERLRRHLHRRHPGPLRYAIGFCTSMNFPCLALALS